MAHFKGIFLIDDKFYLLDDLYSQKDLCAGGTQNHELPLLLERMSESFFVVLLFKNQILNRFLNIKT
jgi:hypothetical protein